MPYNGVLYRFVVDSFSLKPNCNGQPVYSRYPAILRDRLIQVGLCTDSLRQATFNYLTLSYRRL